MKISPRKDAESVLYSVAGVLGVVSSHSVERCTPLSTPQTRQSVRHQLPTVGMESILSGQLKTSLHWRRTAEKAPDDEKCQNQI